MSICARKIVIFSLFNWHGAFSSTTRSLAEEFSKKDEVLYVNAPSTLKDFVFGLLHLQKRQSSLKSRFEKIHDNLTVYYPSFIIPYNFLPPGRLYRFLKRINEGLIFSDLKKILQPSHEFIYLNIFNPFFDHRNYLQPYKFIYYSVDAIDESLYVAKHGKYLEPLMLKNADIALATSRELFKHAKKYSKTAYLLPNAANVELFSMTNVESNPFKHSFEKVICFVGHLDGRVDISFLEKVVNSLKNYYFVFIGPCSVKKEINHLLRTANNLYLVGSVSQSELPAYLAQSDCGIIPFKRNKLTAGIYPLKINEYLAMGLPVVSTGFSSDIMDFSKVVSIADEVETFVRKIQEELNTDSLEKVAERKNVAQKNSWSKRADRFREIIAEVENKPIIKEYQSFSK